MVRSFATGLPQLMRGAMPALWTVWAASPSAGRRPLLSLRAQDPLY